MRDVLLRLRTTHYERAQELAEKVRERADKVLRTARAMGDELRTSLDRARELGETKSRPQASSAGQAIDSKAIGKRLRGLGELREKGEGLVNALSAGSLPRLMSLMGPLAPALGGAMFAVLAPVVDKLMKELEQRFEARLAARESAFLARLEEERFRSDYARRLEEDPRFAREQARLAFDLTVRDERWLGPRIDRAAAELVADEFGL